MSPSLLSYYLSKLADNDIVDASSYGKKRGYSLKNRDEIIQILEKYKVHIQLHLSIEGLQDAWKDFGLV